MSFVVGQRIIGMRRMTDEELELEGWEVNRRHGAPFVLQLENGVLIYPSRDDEGNGPGSLFGRAADGECFYVTEGA